MPSGCNRFRDDKDRLIRQMPLFTGRGAFIVPMQNPGVNSGDQFSRRFVGNLYRFW